MAFSAELSPLILSKIFLELASEQRMTILIKLMKQKYKISSMAKELSATPPEVHRNFQRMIKTGLISKTVDGNYELTTFGKAICFQLPLFQTIDKNKKFFQDHSFGKLPEKFIVRLGMLSNAKLISGYVKVMEKWDEIYQNTEKYIKNTLIEVSYSDNLVNILLKKLEKEIKIFSIFYEGAIVTKKRREMVEKPDFSKYVKNELLTRKMRKTVDIVLVMNEKEVGVSFPDQTGKPDLSCLFYSTDEKFHDWCEDYFQSLWETSNTFREEKLVE